MYKMTFNDFCTIMAHDISKNQFYHEIEIEFRINNSSMYQNSWLGKMVDKGTKKEIYWFGLTKDGLQAYEYDTFEQFSNAKVFCNKSIKEIWDLVSLFSIDGCDIQERLSFYLDSPNNSIN